MGMKIVHDYVHLTAEIIARDQRSTVSGTSELNSGLASELASALASGSASAKFEQMYHKQCSNDQKLLITDCTAI